MKPRYALSMLLLLSLSALDAGCTEGSYELVLAYPDEAAFNAARWVELHISTDACQALQTAERTPEHEFDPHGELPAPGALEYGAVSFLARVRDVSCRTFLQACVAVQMKQGELVTVRIPLELTDGASCATHEQCAGGPCLSVDAAVIDAGSADLVAIDSASADAVSTDLLAPDATSTDAADTDAAVTDAASTDAASTDAASTDAASTDAADMDAADTDAADTDAAVTDAASTDAAVTDAADTCVPNTSSCERAVLVVCDASGQISDVDTCEFGCSATADACNVCTPSSTWCEDPSTLATCRSDGSGHDTSPCAEGCSDVRGACSGPLVDIYRSVGPSSTAPLATGAGNSLVVAGDVATFSSPLPTNTGVGDALQYDSDDSGSIDTVAFIVARSSGTEMVVRSANGGLPLPTAAADVDWALHRAYTALTAALNGSENTGISAAVRDFDAFSGGLDLTDAGYNARWHIACYGDGVDDAQAVVDGWVTGPETYLHIYTPVSPAEVGVSQRHDGSWRDDRYRLEASGTALLIQHDYTLVEGLQVLAIPAGGLTSAVHIQLGTVGVTVSHTLGGFESTSSNQMRAFYDDGEGSEIFNNVAFGATSDTSLTSGFYHHNAAVSRFYNNTAVNCRTGFLSYEGVMTVRNCLARGGTYGFGTDSGGSFAASSDYNLSEANMDAPGPHSARGRAELRDIGARDFRLSARDAFARDRGLNLAADPDLAFTVDLDGETRDATWDIGADEYTGSTRHAVRSVGPGASAALASGGADLAVAGTVAAFGVALPASVGVGDVIQYDASGDGALDSVAIVHGRQSSTRLVVRAPDGAMPTPTSAPDQDWAILRAYTSLAAALDGDENSAIDAGLANFDSFSGGLDISSGGADRVWDIACYAGDADTSSTSTAGWVTGPLNDLRIFTPVRSDQVGASQRHDGHWSDSAYRLVVSDASTGIDLRSAHVSVTGLQVHLTNNDTWSCLHVDGMPFIGADVRISHNILRGAADSATDADWHSGVELYDFGAGELRIWNNVIYDFQGIGTSNCGVVLDDPDYTVYLYNNTIASCTCGIDDMYDRVVARNNLVHGCTDNYVGDFLDGSHNLSGPSQTDAPGTSPINGVTVSFVDSAAGDYRLSAADLSATDVGTALDADPDLPFDDDIEGERRPYNGFWDVGADEYRP